MRLASGLLLAAVFLADPCRAAPTADCKQAAGRIERTICSDPGLRRTNAALDQTYLDVLHHTEGIVRAGFIAGQRAWLASRDQACATVAPGCLASAYAERQAQLDALTARVAFNDLNLLNDTEPLVLSGSWKAGVPRVLGHPAGKPSVALADAAAGEGLPDAGTMVTGRPGKLCYGTDCFVAGLEPIRLSAVYSDERARALGVQPGSPAYQVTLTAVHAIRLVQDRTGVLLALFDACAPLLKSCVTAAQDWSPQNATAAIVKLADRYSETRPAR